MMDNATHHSVGQLSPTNASNLNTIQQQTNNKSPGEPDHFLTIRLLMQGKVSARFSPWMISFKNFSQEVGSIIGKRGDNIKAIREEVTSFPVRSDP